ncbi:MAG: acyltransferase [Acidimicrobiales bacterium]
MSDDTLTDDLAISDRVEQWIQDDRPGAETRGDRGRFAFVSARNHLLQLAAQSLPGGHTLRPWLHKRRGVQIGEGSFIGLEALIETAMPHLVQIGIDVHIGLRSVIVAHSHREADEYRASGRVEPKVRIGDHAFIGPGAIILENVVVGEGAVVTAGSVVKTSIPPMTVVQGVPAQPVAKCGVALGCTTPTKEFTASLRPLGGARGK